MRIYAFASLSLLAALALTACDAKVNVNVANPSAQPSAGPSSNPSSDPSSNPSAQPSDPPSATPNPNATAQPTAAPSTGSGKLTIQGSALFNKYNVNYRAGMKWVYGMRLADLAVPQIPSLPGGVTIPGLPSSGGSGMDLGTMTMEVLKVEGETVTMQTTIVTNAAPTQIPPRTTTFQKSAMANLYTESQGDGVEGTATWTAAGSESVTVPAGSYSADIINGVFDVTSLQNGVRADLDQTVKLWISNGVGMVKEEVKTSLSGTGSAGSVQSDSTTIIELKSFSN